MLLNDLLNNKSNKKNTIHHLYRITINLLEYAYISSYVGCTYIILFTCIINRIQEKKTNHLHTSFSYHIHIVTFGSVNMYTIHKTTYNPTLRTIIEKKHSNTTQKSLALALLVEVFLQEQRVYVSM